MVVKSLKSRGFLEEVFNWQWNYYFLNEAGVKYLVTFLGLRDDVVPATYKKTKMNRPTAATATKGKGEEAEGDDIDAEKAEAKAAAAKE